MRIVGKFLHDIIKDENDDEPVSLLPVLSTSPNTRMSLSLNTVSDNIGSMFTLHSVHDFTPYEMLQLVFTVFKGVPKSYQVFLCSPVTTQRQLDLFFERTMHWRGIQYLIIGVNNLSNELQEVKYVATMISLLRMSVQLLSDACTKMYRCTNEGNNNSV